MLTRIPRRPASFVANSNTLEHSAPFLILLWLNCAYVNAPGAGYLGAYYIFHRFVYQVFFGLYGRFTFLCEFCTQPGYATLYYLAFSLFFKCYNGSDWIDYLPSYPLLLPALGERGLYPDFDVPTARQHRSNIDNHKFPLSPFARWQPCSTSSCS